MAGRGRYHYCGRSGAWHTNKSPMDALRRQDPRRTRPTLIWPGQDLGLPPQFNEPLEFHSIGQDRLREATALDTAPLPALPLVARRAEVYRRPSEVSRPRPQRACCFDHEKDAADSRLRPSRRVPRRRDGRMRRRELLATLGSAAAAWPLIVRAQQPTIPVIGFLGPTETWDSPEHEAAFYAGLAEAGYTEGRNVAIDYRWCGGRYDRLPGMADDLVRRSIAVIVAWGYPCLAAAREATTTIPIVFYYGGDPVRDGIVASFKRPGGNITGATLFNNEIGAKRLQLLRTLLPKAALIGFIINPANPTAEPQL